MGKVVFLDNPTKTYDAKAINYSQNVVRLIFQSDMPTDELVVSGFYIANEHNYSNMTGDTYYSYKTIWKKTNNEIDLSNDESVWQEPVITLEDTKIEKITEFSSKCNASILIGTDVELSNGATKHFSYTNDDQANIKELFDVAVQTQIPQFYHADGEFCQLYSVEDIIKIYMMESFNKISCITYFNQIKAYILSLETIEEVNNVVYGQELIGQYLETYNSAINQAKLGLYKLLGITEE